MQTLGANRRGSTKIYIAMCLLIASAGSLFNPVLSLFLNTELGLDPLRISIFFILLPIVTIVIVQTVAFFSDMGLQRPAIICIAGIFGILSAGLLYLRPNFWILCTLGLIFLGSYSVAFPQIFASAREYSVKYVHGSIMFTTFLRSLASLSWVVGPPVAYGLAIGFSFDVLFLVTAGMFAIYSICCYFFLPSVMERSKTTVQENVAWWKNSSVMLLFLSVAFAFTAFSSYIISMPLYVTQELRLETSLPGYMMGLAAFLEIPIMLFAARIARRIGLKSLMIMGSVAQVVFLVLLGYVDFSSASQLLVIQILPAIFIGFIGSMGMVFFQELLPQIPGQATSLYINGSAVGQIVGGAFISLASSGSYQIIFLAGCAMSIIGTVILFFVKKPQLSDGA